MALKSGYGLLFAPAKRDCSDYLGNLICPRELNVCANVCVRVDVSGACDVLPLAIEE